MSNKIYIIRPVQDFEITKWDTIYQFNYQSHWDYGFTNSFKEAEEAVLSNMGDMHETIYDYVVITEQKFRICNSIITREIIYRYNDNGYEKIAEMSLEQEEELKLFNGYKTRIKVTNVEELN